MRDFICCTTVVQYSNFNVCKFVGPGRPRVRRGYSSLREARSQEEVCICIGSRSIEGSIAMPGEVSNSSPTRSCERYS